MTLLELLGKQYERGGRGPDVYDCWGMARIARHALHGKPLMPLFPGVDHTLPRKITEGLAESVAAMRRCEPEPGAIAPAFRGRLCVHIGTVIEIPEGLRILDTNAETGPRIMRIKDFEMQYTRVEYWND